MSLIPRLASRRALVVAVAAIGLWVISSEVAIHGAGAEPARPLVAAVDKITANAGDTLVYTFTYTNLGRKYANNVTISAKLPAETTFGMLMAHSSDGVVTWPLGFVPKGQTRRVSVSLQLDRNLPLGTSQVAVTAQVSTLEAPTPVVSNTVTTKIVRTP